MIDPAALTTSADARLVDLYSPMLKVKGRGVGVPTPAMDALYSLTRVMAERRGLL